MENFGGAAETDPRYAAVQVKAKSYLPNAAQMDKLYFWFGGHHTIQFSEDEWNAYDKNTIEPFAIQKTQSVFLALTNKDLLVKGTHKRKYRKVRQSRAPCGESIEKRPESIESRTTFGQWEMDTVIGRKKSKETLLVLTERITRCAIIIGMPDRTAVSVVRALDVLEKNMANGLRRYSKASPLIMV